MPPPPLTNHATKSFLSPSLSFLQDAAKWRVNKQDRTRPLNRSVQPRLTNTNTSNRGWMEKNPKKKPSILSRSLHERIINNCSEFSLSLHLRQSSPVRSRFVIYHSRAQCKSSHTSSLILPKQQHFELDRTSKPTYLTHYLPVRSYEIYVIHLKESHLSLTWFIWFRFISLGS